MGVDRAPVGDDEARGPERLQSDVVGTGGDRALDAGGEQLFEGSEEHVLQVDGEREQPVEESGDGGSSSRMPLASVSFSPVVSSKV